jgi:hypothetical protein
MAAGNLFMAHRSGFTKKVLLATLMEAGFKNAGGRQRSDYFDLWAIASKADMGEDMVRNLVVEHFP